MKKLTVIVYYIRMFLFITHFYFVFIMLPNILNMKIYGYLFLLVYFIYVIKNIMQLMSKKTNYANDLIYNLMQIGFLSYVIFITLKTFINEVYVTKVTYHYFMVNYIISSILMIFIIAYSIIGVKNTK